MKKDKRRRGVGRSILGGIQSLLTKIRIEIVAENPEITSSNIKEHETWQLVDRMMRYAQIFGYRKGISRNISC